MSPRKICCAQLDLRHWFHQILLEPNGRLASLFHVVCDGTKYQWLRLHMGWSFSPFVCQVLSTLLYLHREDGEEELFIIPAEQAELPQLLHLRKANGFATVLYDNFCVSEQREARQREEEEAQPQSVIQRQF